jgi:4-amino-4-deoxy-L-arabinose transferase-like glycosyltransferase
MIRPHSMADGAYDRLLAGLRILAASALVARLGSLGRDWLPPTGVLAGLVVGLLAIDVLGRALRSSASPDGRSWRAALRRHAFVVGLGTLTALALLVRLPAIGADLGHTPLDIDEERLAGNVRHFFETGELVHTTVEHYPGLAFWIFAGSSFLAYLSGLVLGSASHVHRMPVEGFVLAVRVTNAFAGAATVALTGTVGKRLSGSAAGLLGAAVVAVAPLSIQTTTLARNDPVQVMFVTAAVCTAIALCASERRTLALLAGALAGMATGIKYSSVLVLLAVLLAAALSVPMRARLERVALVLVAFALAVAVTNHFVWTDFPNFVDQLSSQVAITGPEHWAATEDAAGVYMRTLATAGPGWALLLLSAAFAIHGLASRRGETWVFLAFPLSYVWFMTGRPSQLPRWIYPLVPFVALSGACALVAGLRVLQAGPSWIGGRTKSLPRPLAAVVVLAAVWQPAWAGVSVFLRGLRPATYHLVERWIREHSTREDAVLVEVGWLDLEGSPARVRRVARLAEVLKGGGLYFLCAHRWIVVPEPQGRNPALRSLTLVRRFPAEQSSLGGHRGYDFDLYGPPEGCAGIEAADVRLDAPEAAAFLGPDWEQGGARGTGLALPPRGAGLFLPPLARDEVRVELEVIGKGLPSDALPILVNLERAPIVLTEVASKRPGTRLLVAVIRLPSRPRGIELRVGPAGSAGDVRITRLRFS